jgi:2-polyprenyl-6-methoxyphenol hydroxylase-like FAD-dependent oxidoreductase
MFETQVVIVGGGIAGASLACALAHRQIASILIERRKVPVDLNRGDGLQPRSLEILDAWGLLPMVQGAGALKSYGIEVHHPLMGKLLEIDLGVVNTHYPYMLNLPHQEIEKLLLDYAAKSGYCRILYGSVKEAVFVEERAVGVCAILNGEEVQVNGTVIVGADGAQSLLRKSAAIEANMHNYDHDLLIMHAQRPAWFSERLRTRVFMHRKGAVVLLPLPHNQMRIAVLIKSGSARQWKNFTQLELLQQLAKHVPQLANVEHLEQHGEHIYRMRKMHAERYAQKGIVLVGDSAHLTHSAGGQGMNMALQDAEALASTLHTAFHEQSALDDAYAAYEQVRRPLNQSVIERANFMAWQLWSPSVLAFLGRTLFTSIPRYLLPFVYKRVTRSLAWGNAGIVMPKD